MMFTTVRPRLRSLGSAVLLGAALLGTTLLRAAPFQIEEASIASIQDAILHKKLTSTEVVKLYLARIKAYNGTGVAEPNGILGRIETIPHSGKINSLGTLNLRPAALKAWGFPEKMARTLTDPVDGDPALPDALETAAALDKAFAKTGKLVGPLHGVVFAIKDQYDTIDLRTTGGADVPYANDRPPHDATFIERLRAAGAIILAKSQMGEYASGIPRSSWGGTINNPYDTERSPMGSSSGSGTSVAANLVTAAIGEETGTSIRGPSCYNNLVGIAGTQELVSRYGMMEVGINTRVGPIARTVEDAARILDVIAGYDPKDYMTAFGVGRLPSKPYASFTHTKRLDGIRIGVIREYMDREAFTDEDKASIDLIEKAIEDLRALGATIVDPGPGGALFTKYLRKNFNLLYSPALAPEYPELFPVNEKKEPVGDRIPTLLNLTMDPSLVPAKINIRSLKQMRGEGDGKFSMDLYLRQRGDANIKTIDDLLKLGKYFDDDRFGNRKTGLERKNQPTDLDTRTRIHNRYALQYIIMETMADQKLDVLISPTNNIPPPKLGSPNVPRKNGRPLVWSFLGAQGFPTMTVPAGFTKEVYDRVLDPSSPPIPSTAVDAKPGETEPASKLSGPVAAVLPVGIDFLARPFDEATLLTVGAAYQNATHHRMPPPDFGPLPAKK